MELWIPVIVALLAGGTAGSVINHILNRPQRELDAKVKRIEVQTKERDSTIAGMAILIDQLQEERQECREEVKELREELATFREETQSEIQELRKNVN
jgi:peptidoglycan hydrolase CwlO-like protein